MLTSCTQQIKFNKDKWNLESDRGYFHYRNSMLQDLLNNSNLEGMTVTEIKNYFGDTNYELDSSNKNLQYEVYQEWDGIDPSYTKYLILRVNEINKVDSIYIEEFYH